MVQVFKLSKSTLSDILLPVIPHLLSLATQQYQLGTNYSDAQEPTIQMPNKWGTFIIQTTTYSIDKVVLFA